MFPGDHLINSCNVRCRSDGKDYMQIHTHLFLVHEDMISNITPALDPAFCPEEVFLLSSPVAIDQTERLELILKQSGVGVSRWPIDDPWDVEHIRERVLEFVVNHDHGDIALNVTGGTKPMSLAAYEIFRYLDKPVYYVQPERDYVVWLHPRDRASFDLADRIKLPAYFTAYGMRLVSCRRDGIPEHLRTLTESLIKGVSKFSGPLSILNALASQSEGSLVSPSLDERHVHSAYVQELIDLFVSHDLVKRIPQNKLCFPSEDARFYVNGGWLEEHVYGVLFNLRKEIPTIQDLARNIKVEWDIKGSPVENELDVAILADNRLYIIECKTKKFTSDKGPDVATADVLYKLDTLRDYLGGAGSRAMLVSYRDLTKATRLRAKEFGIEICGHEVIHKIETTFKNWITKKLLKDEKTP